MKTVTQNPASDSLDPTDPDAIRDAQALALHPARGLHHLQPRLSRPHQLRLRRRRWTRPDPPHQQLALRAPRRPLLLRILPLSNPRRSLRKTQKRPPPDLLRLAQLGHPRLAHRRHPQLLAARTRPPPPRRGRKLHPPGDADPAHQLVHPRRALPHQHHPPPRQPGHPHLDVRRNRLPHPRPRLADDLHRRRPARGPLGIRLARRHSRQASRRRMDERRNPHPAQRAARARAVAPPAGSQHEVGAPASRRHLALHPVFLLEHRQLRLRALAALRNPEGCRTRHRHHRPVERACLTSWRLSSCCWSRTTPTAAFAANASSGPS